MRTMVIVGTALSAMASGPALGDDICHGRGPDIDYFFQSEADLLSCLNGGGLSGLTIGADPLLYAIRKTSAPIWLEDVVISGSFIGIDAAFVDPRPDTSAGCAGLAAEERRTTCQSNLALLNDLEFRNVRVDGNLDFSQVTFAGTTTLDHVEAKLTNLNGSVFLKSLTVTAPAGHVAFEGLTTAGDLTLGSFDGQALSLRGTDIGGPLLSADMQLERLYVGQSVFHGPVNFIGISAGEGFIYESTFEADLDLSGGNFGNGDQQKDLTIADTDVAGAVDLTGVQVAGSLRLGTAVRPVAILDGVIARSICTINVDCP